MKIKVNIVLIMILSSVITSTSAFGQVSADPVGVFNLGPMLANEWNMVSIPLRPVTIERGILEAVNGSEVSDTDRSWPENDFVDCVILIADQGSAAYGRKYGIVSNQATSLILEAGADPAGDGVSAGDRYIIYALMKLNRASSQDSGTISRVSGLELEDDTKSWENGVFEYNRTVYFTSGAANEKSYPIAGNTVNTLTLVEGCDPVSDGAREGDSYEIYRRWDISAGEVLGGAEGPLTAGAEMEQADEIQIWNGTGFEVAWLHDGTVVSPGGWYTPGFESSDLKLDAGQGFWLRCNDPYDEIENPIYLPVVGEVSQIDEKVELKSGWMMMGMGHPWVCPDGSDLPLSNGGGSNDANLSLTGGPAPGEADEVQIWNGSGYGMAWFSDGSGIAAGWYTSGFNPTTITFAPGTAFWIKALQPAVWEKKLPKE